MSVMKFVFLLWGASLASGFSATPVGKVVEMLQDMKSEGEKEKKRIGPNGLTAKKDEKVQFAAYKQFCETTEAQKVRVIQDAKDKVEVLTAQVEKGESDASKLAEEIAEHTKDLESASAEKEALVAARSKEREAFDSMLQDYVESIEAIGRALKELKANTAKNEEGALVQLSALKLPDKASRGLQVLMADNFEEIEADPQDKLLSFLGEETGSVATRQSGGIVDMLEKLEEKFMDERLEIEKDACLDGVCEQQLAVEETAKRHAHELLAQSLTRKAEEAGKEKQQKETLKAKKLQEKASAAGDLSETEAPFPTGPGGRHTSRSFDLISSNPLLPTSRWGPSSSCRFWMEPKCHYRVLGIQEQATLPEIKKAYKDLSRRHHPDKSQDPNATARFQRIAEAYQELKDQERRLSVDDWMARHVASSSSLELVRIELNVVGRLEPLMPALGSGYHLFRSPTCGVVLIVAPAGASLEAGRQRLRECIDELTGLRAPPGGLIFIVPSNRLDVVPRMVLALPQLLWQFGASISQVAHDRIVLPSSVILPVEWHEVPERRVAEAVLAELSPRLQDLPRSCEGKELAALLIALQHRASRCDTQKTAASSSEAEALQLPGALPVIVKRLMERAHERRTTGGGKHVLAAELLEELHPFNAAQVTGAIVSLHSPTSPLENQALVMLMQAAACDMHEAFDGPVKSGGACWAPLQVVRDSVLSAGRRPFLDVFQERKTAQDKLLVASAALRVSIELFDKKKACPVCLSPGYSSFEPFAGLCAALANLYKLVSPFIEEHIELVTEAFEKLAAACEHLALGDAAREPSGLARLADAFATLTFSRAVSPSQRFVAAAQRGLAQVSKVLVATESWTRPRSRVASLASLAFERRARDRSAVAATRTDEELFTKLAAAANLSSEKLKREVVLKMISSFYQAGFLKKLEQFLKGLAAKSWFQENASMPSLVETLAICLKHLVSDCLEAERMKALVQKMMPSESSSSPSELQSWTELLEGIIMDGKICKQSQKLSWMGGRAIRAHPARVRAALRELGLKMEKAGIPMAKVTSLQPEEEPPVPQVQGPKPRSRSRSTKDGVITVSNCSDPRLGLTLEGQYARDGTNHNKAVYRRIEADPKGSHLPIKLYYWDDRDGKENQGWWFGPTVGGEEVWLHNPRALHFPPADGWDFSLKVALNHRAPAAPKGKAKAKATAPPAAASSAAPSTVDPPAKAAKKARLSEESEEDGFPELTRWLRSLAPSNPHQLMKYYSALVTHFEGDLQQIAAAKIGDAERDGVKRVEPAACAASAVGVAGLTVLIMTEPKSLLAERERANRHTKTELKCVMDRQLDATCTLCLLGGNHHCAVTVRLEMDFMRRRLSLRREASLAQEPGQAGLKTDEEYLAELTTTCKKKAGDFEDRQKLRDEELVAIGEAAKAISEITSSSLVQMKAKQASKSTVLAQLRSEVLSPVQVDVYTQVDVVYTPVDAFMR
eukprot:g11348.t2